MSSGVLFDAPGPKARRRHAVLTVLGALVLLGLLWLVYRRLDDKGQLTSAMWKPFHEASTWQDYILPGLLGTLKAAGTAMVGAAVFGIVFAMARMSHVRPLRWVAGVIVELGRAVPVLLMMLFVYGWLSTRGDNDNNPFIATVVALVIYNGAVVAEVIRSGVDQLPNGQREGGLSVGLTQTQTLRSILLPQAITAMMPTLISQLVVVLKDTALGYNVLYGEMLYKAKNAAVSSANIVPMIFVVALIYIALNYTISKIAVLVEKRLQNRGQAAGAGEHGDGPGAGVTAGVAVTGAPGVNFGEQHTT